jgi:hypothetical protein
MTKSEILNHSSVLDVKYKSNEEIDYLEVKPSGNLTLFSKLRDSQELYMGNVSIRDNNLKINIRRDKTV